MNKFFLGIAATAAVVLQSCEKTDGIRDEIDRLKDRVSVLESKVGVVNQNILTLHKLMDESLVIVDVIQTSNGYVLELSDGRKYPVVLGERIPALVPTVGIDAEGYWIVSLDGERYERITDGDGFVSAFPSQNGIPGENASGVTPQLKVDAEGCWLVSLDAGVTYEPLLQDGEKVNAVGGNITVTYSGFFEHVEYDSATKRLYVELKTGDRLVFPVEDSFELIIAAGDAETIRTGETRTFEVVQRGVAAARITAPAGWVVRLEERELAVTAPKVYDAASADVAITVTATSEKGYVRIRTLALTLLNGKTDVASAVVARKTEPDVLLDGFTP